MGGLAEAWKYTGSGTTLLVMASILVEAVLKEAGSCWANRVWGARVTAGCKRYGGSDRARDLVPVRDEDVRDGEMQGRGGHEEVGVRDSQWVRVREVQPQ